MIKKLLFIIMMMWVTAGNAQKCLPDSGFWGDFSGKLGDRDIQLSIYRSGAGVLSGDYRFTGKPPASVNEKKPLEVKGNIKDCFYYLEVLNDNKTAIGKFIFQYTYDKAKKADNFNGTYTAADHTQNAVVLRLDAMVGGTLSQRYFELFGTTQEVDSFAAKIKTAIINNNKEWLAAHCRYPLNINSYADRRKQKIIKTQQEFITGYNTLFSKAYRDKFSKMTCYNMFSNHMGASMGKGEVWMNHTPASTADHYEYCITAFELF